MEKPVQRPAAASVEQEGRSVRALLQRFDGGAQQPVQQKAQPVQQTTQPVQQTTQPPITQQQMAQLTVQQRARLFAQQRAQQAAQAAQQPISQPVQPAVQQATQPVAYQPAQPAVQQQTPQQTPQQHKQQYVVVESVLLIHPQLDYDTVTDRPNCLNGAKGSVFVLLQSDNPQWYLVQTRDGQVAAVSMVLSLDGLFAKEQMSRVLLVSFSPFVCWILVSLSNCA